MQSVTETDLKYCFDECPLADAQRIMVLDPDECREIWDKHFDPKSKHLYDLPKDLWLNSNASTPIGEWLTEYNTGNSSGRVSGLIQSATRWHDTQSTFLVKSSRRILRFAFHDFSVCWRAMLCAFDDGPVLIGSSPTAPAVCFAPLGAILMIVR
jgi:hypothetical protein